MKEKSTIAISNVLLSLQIDKVILTLALMIALPLFIHGLSSGRNDISGLIWLPIFYAPIIAVIFFRFHVAVLAAIFAPFLNLFVTGFPNSAVAKLLSVELFLYVIIMKFLVKQKLNLIFVAVSAFAITKIISTVFIDLFHGDTDVMNILQLYTSSIKQSLPGITVLLVISILSKSLKSKFNEPNNV